MAVAKATHRGHGEDSIYFDATKNRYVGAVSLGFDGSGARELPRLDIMMGFLEYRLDAAPRALPIFASAARSCRQLQDWDCYGIASQNLALLAAESMSYTTALAESDRPEQEIDEG